MKITFISLATALLIAVLVWASIIIFAPGMSLSDFLCGNGVMK